MAATRLSARFGPTDALRAIERIIESRVQSDSADRPSASAALYEIDLIVRDVLAAGPAESKRAAA